THVIGGSNGADRFTFLRGRPVGVAEAHAPKPNGGYLQISAQHACIHRQMPPCRCHSYRNDDNADPCSAEVPIRYAVYTKRFGSDETRSSRSWTVPPNCFVSVGSPNSFVSASRALTLSWVSWASV